MASLSRKLARLLVIALLVSGCSDDSAPVTDAAPPTDGTPADSASADSQDQAVAPDAAPDSGAPAACEAPPSGFCDPEAADPCLDGDELCQCVPVCSGVQPPPGEEYIWQCADPPDPRCPATAPSQDAACPEEGLICIYGSCSGVKASCTSSGWLIEDILPPP